MSGSQKKPVNHNAFASYRKGFVKGQKKGIMDLKKILLKKADKASCSVSIYTIESVVQEMLWGMEDENS